jgi:hypothetical protein
MRSTQPLTLETALMTFGEWERLDSCTLKVCEGNTAVCIEIDCGDQPFEIAAEELQEDVHSAQPPLRIAIRLNDKVSRAQITLRITPVHEC